MHRDFHELPEPADIVVADRASAALRTLAADAAVPLATGGPQARTPHMRGRPRVLGAAPSGRTGGVNLVVGRHFLAAGSTGGVVVQSAEANAWEEFVPVPPGDLAILRRLHATAWLSLRDRLVIAAGECRVGADFELVFGAIRIGLRDNPRLVPAGARGAEAEPIVAVATDGRIERLRPFEPLILWRNDGSAEADAEIDLGIASVRAHGDVDVLQLVETARSTEALAAAVPDGAGRLIAIARTAREDGILDFAGALEATDADVAGPILCLANGVVCDGSLAPLLASVAAAREVAAGPFLAAATGPRSARPFFEADPREEPGAIDPDPAMLGLPHQAAWVPLARLVAVLGDRAPRDAADRFDDAREQDLLRAVLTATASGDSSPFAPFIGAPEAGSAAGAARGLRNLRRWPQAVRAGLMRRVLGIPEPAPPE